MIFILKPQFRKSLSSVEVKHGCYVSHYSVTPSLTVYDSRIIYMVCNMFPEIPVRE